MFCCGCGREIEASARYCSQCGQATGTGIAPRAPRRLFRLSRDKKIGGVCAGFAEYLDIDVTLVRILTLALICITGFVPGLIAYLLAWVIMPVAPEAPAPAAQSTPVTPAA
jgi:phage shock protein C